MAPKKAVAKKKSGKRKPGAKRDRKLDVAQRRKKVAAERAAKVSMAADLDAARAATAIAEAEVARLRAEVVALTARLEAAEAAVEDERRLRLFAEGALDQYHPRRRHIYRELREG